MVDTEVLRLRKLRNTAMQARALALKLEQLDDTRNAAFTRGALICWRIAKIATGRLRAHPYANYQKGRSEWRDLIDATSASLTASFAKGRSRSCRVHAQELQRVARELDDVRALTWSADLSDALGRAQLQLRPLLKEFAESGPITAAGARVSAPVCESGLDDMAATDWPYLAI